MESIQITYIELTHMIENSVTYQDMNNDEKSEFLKEFINRYDIQGGKIMTKKDIINQIENNNKYSKVKITKDGDVSGYSKELNMRLFIGNINDSYFNFYNGISGVNNEK